MKNKNKLYKPFTKAPKFMQRAQIDRPHVLVLKEKYGDRYFLVEDDYGLDKVALKVLKDRLDENWIWDPREDALNGEPELTRIETDRLPPGPIKEVAKLAWRKFDEEQGAHKDECRRYEDAERAVEEQDGRMAYTILNERKDHEYEEYRLEPLETA